MTLLFLAGIGGVLATEAGAASRAAQPSFLRVRVIDATSGFPLPNADVIDLATNQHRFTDTGGEVRVPWPAAGELRLRVRQIGFRAEERSMLRMPASGLTPSDSIVVVLERVAYALPAVTTEIAGVCGVDTDSASRMLSVLVLEQLRHGADRYQEFRRAYPFRVKLERRTATMAAGGKPAHVRAQKETADSERWGDRYDPDRIVYRTALGFSVPILFVATLADPAFWKRHCFVVRGVVTMNGSRAIRLEFTPTADVRSTEWAGAAFVDSAISILRRVEFQLTGLDGNAPPRRLEGYTTFMSPSPFVVIPDTTIAVWWRRGAGADGDWGQPDVGQMVRVESLSYRKAKPPQHSPR